MSINSYITQHYLDHGYTLVHQTTFAGDTIRNPDNTIEIILRLRHLPPTTLSATIRTPTLPYKSQIDYYRSQNHTPGIWDYGANIVAYQEIDLTDPDSLSQLDQLIKNTKIYL